MNAIGILMGEPYSVMEFLTSFRDSIVRFVGLSQTCANLHFADLPSVFQAFHVSAERVMQECLEGILCGHSMVVSIVW